MTRFKSHHSKLNKVQRGARQASGTLQNESHPDSPGGFSAGEPGGMSRRGWARGPAGDSNLLGEAFGRIERFREKLDEAFAGQPFLPDLPPDCPANRRRFWVYDEEASALTELLWRAVELWMISCGMKWEDNWIPLQITEAVLRTRQQDAKTIQD